MQLHIQGQCQNGLRLEDALSHTSLKSNLAKNPSPEMKPIYSESSCHGDFKNNLGIALTCNVRQNSLRFKYYEFFILYI